MILNGIAEKLKRQSKDDFKGRHFEAWLIVQAVTWYFRYPLSRRDLESMFLERGFEVDHSTVNRWVLAYAPLIEKRLRQFRRPHCGSIRVDETYVKIRGKWRYLYRAIDKHGVPVDFLLTAKRDLDAAKRFFRKALKGESLLAPKKIGTDGASVYPTAISEGLRDQQDDPQRRKLPAAVCGGEQPAVREMDQQGPDENRNEGDRDGAREEARQQEQSADDLKAHHGGGERRRIAEAHLGLRLLNRTTRRVSLTDEGAGYLERCRDILSAIDEAEQEFASRMRSVLLRERGRRLEFHGARRSGKRARGREGGLQQWRGHLSALGCVRRCESRPARILRSKVKFVEPGQITSCHKLQII